MAFPSTLSTFNRPNASDPLNSPSHSALHNTVSSALGQVEAVLGVRGASSVVGTINSAVFSPGSTGGGHIQGAAFGGTGQTTYSKGDILVAQSASVLGKLSVGADGRTLVANSSVASGMEWGTPRGGYILSAFNKTGATNSTSPVVLAATSILGGTLGLNGVLRVTAKWTMNNDNASNRTGTLDVLFGGVLAATHTSQVVVNNTGQNYNEWLISNMASNTLKVTTGINASSAQSTFPMSVLGYSNVPSALSIDTSVDQNFLIRGNTSDTTGANHTLQSVVVEVIK